MKNQHDHQKCIRLCINPYCTNCDALEKHTNAAIYMITLILNHGKLIKTVQFLFWQSNLLMPYWHLEKNLSRHMLLGS